MRKLKSIALAGLIVATLPAAAHSAGTVRIFTFEGYADEEWVGPFEASTGCQVNVTYTGSVDELFAKMIASKGADYDLISIDTSLFPQYIDKGLIVPFDAQNIPNLKNLLPEFADVAEVMAGESRFGIPIAWGSIGLIYDKAVFPEPPTSWNALWDPATASKAIVLDDANNNIVNTATLLGFEDPYNLSLEQFEQVKQKLIEQKRSILSYYAGFEDGVNVWESSGASLMFSMGESQVISLAERGYDVGYAIPQEGAIGWLDTWALSTGAQDVECAHQWVDYVLAGDVGPMMTTAHGYGNTTQSNDGLDYADRLNWLRPVESLEMRAQVWSEVKASQ
ncbi:extracellular solute-binding protein [Devosia sp.]|uniref:ABC transporter substrate-binding protein n=1 Tax=Devosia sp. TaxID=1871048 RepID=UPI0025D995C4|nr:extracellular solute-binding protein [Devosia sp.]MCR6637117.1 extracellular solute-binding protein [Devosia sp.]